MIQPVLEYSEYIVERTQQFTGRSWVFEQINTWLANTTHPRYFLLVGEPGCGKTALAARLCQFSQGNVAPPHGLLHLQQDFLDACHFSRARDSDCIDPLTFARSLALQLARYPQYAQALLTIGERDVNIRVEQHIQEVREGGTVQAVVIEHLTVANLNAQECFNRIVRDPLRTLYSNGFGAPITILVDGLDEALFHPGRPTIVELLSRLQTLPSQVRFILTSRSDARVEEAFPEAASFLLSAPLHDQHNRKDVGDYLKMRLAPGKEYAEKIAHLTPEQINSKIESLTDKAAGNFQYITFLLNAISRDLHTFDELDGLPEGLDNLYADSLGRVVQMGKKEWSTDYAPVVGVLSVAQESLTFEQLQALTRQAERALWDCINDLQQFIESVQSAKRQGKDSEEVEVFSLYHQSFIDFLRRRQLILPNEKKVRNAYYLPAEEWHRQIADVCETSGFELIWQDAKGQLVEQARRMYARHHYITHLYQAQERKRLFEVLDDGVYGREKLRHDSSISSYAQDVDLGRQAAGWEGWKIEEGITYTTYLWRYTLLYCSLRSRANQYPVAAFEALVLLKREEEAVGLAELLTESAFKIQVLCSLASRLREQPGQEQKSLQLLMTSQGIARSLDGEVRTNMLSMLVDSFAEARSWEQAEVAMRSIENKAVRARTLQKLINKLVREQQWMRAETIARGIEDTVERAWVLSDLGGGFVQAQEMGRTEALWTEIEILFPTIEDKAGKAFVMSKLGGELAKAHRWERAEELWTEVEAFIPKLVDSSARTWVMSELAYVLLQIQQWGRAEVVTNSIEDNATRVRMLNELIRELARAQQWMRAEEIWNDVEEMSRSIKEPENIFRPLSELGDVLVPPMKWERAMTLCVLVRELARAQRWERAEEVIRRIEDSAIRGWVLYELDCGLAEAQQWERAENLAISIDDNATRGWTLSDLIYELALSKQERRIEALWPKVEATVNSIKIETTRALVQHKLSTRLARMQQWERAKTVACNIEDRAMRGQTVSELICELARAQQKEQAEALWCELESMVHITESAAERAWAIYAIVYELTEFEQWEQAEEVAQSIVDAKVKAKALIELSGYLVRTQRRERAEVLWLEIEKLISLIKDKEAGRDLLSELIHEQVEAQQWNRAKAFVSSIEDYDTRSLMMQVLVNDLVVTEQWYEAETIARGIEDNATRAWVICKLGGDLTRDNQKERGEELWAEVGGIIPTIEDSVSKARVMIQLGVGIARVQQKERAEALWAEVEAIIPTFEKDETRERVSEEFLRALAEAQQWERAEEAYYALRDSMRGYWSEAVLIYALISAHEWERAKAIVFNFAPENRFGVRDKLLSEYVRLLVWAQEWEQVWPVISTIETKDYRAMALSEIIRGKVRLLIQLQEWEQAANQICAIEDRMIKAEALSELLRGLVKAQEWVRSIDITSTIEDRVIKAKALSELLVELTNAQQWGHAETMISIIEDRETREQAVSELLVELAKAQRWEQAESMALRFAEDGTSRQLLREVARVLVHSRKYEELLRLLQRVWLQAETRAYTITYLPLIAGLIPLEPTIGTAFGAAFNWVDAFLQA